MASPARTPAQPSGGNPPPASDCSGGYEFQVSHDFLGANAIGVGDLFYAQFWSRDTGFAPRSSFGATQALHFLVCP